MVFMRENGIRPQFINLYKCKNILLEGFTLNRSPFWLIHPLLSENITVRKVKMQSHGYNNDGCDPESCRNVLIEDCDFDNMVMNSVTAIFITSRFDGDTIITCIKITILNQYIPA